jgi:uncharacterized membrane protein
MEGSNYMKEIQNTNEKKQSGNLLSDLKTNVGKPERFLSTLAGGSMIAYGLKRRDTVGVILSILGGGLAFRGATGHCEVYQKLGIDSADSNYWISGKVDVKQSITVNKPAAELYKFWENLENLPQFMTHLESVNKIDDRKSHWKAKAPLGFTAEWDAEITEKTENKKIEWRSLEGSDVPNTGRVEFIPTIDRGTEVKVTFAYIVPTGKLGSLFAKVFGEEPNQQVAEDLRRFKSLMESGSIIKVEGQSSGRAEKAQAATAK